MNLLVIVALCIGGWLAFRKANGAYDTVSWTKKNEGVRLNSGQIEFVQKVVLLCKFGVVVTDGERTPEEQVQRIIGESEEAISRLYKDKDIVNALLGAPREQWVEIVAGFAERGKFMSRHMTGRAVDFRVSDLTPEQRAKLMKCVEAAGGYALDEGDHIHAQW